MTPLLASIGSFYREGVVDAGREPALFFLVAFLVTFGFIRTSAHMIRAQVSWWPGNVEVGGTHVHHLVWGILLILIVGYLGIVVAPGSPGKEILAALFGVGVGLTLDEFALWLNLKDVYWSEQGRRSIDAVIVAAMIAGFGVLGLTAWVEVAEDVEREVVAIASTFGVSTIILVAICFMKEKFLTGLVGLVVWPVALVGAIRLAKPWSPWARVYSERRMARARERYPHRRVRLPWRKRQEGVRAASADAEDRPADEEEGASQPPAGSG